MTLAELAQAGWRERQLESGQREAGRLRLDANFPNAALDEENSFAASTFGPVSVPDPRCVTRGLSADHKKARHSPIPANRNRSFIKPPLSLHQDPRGSYRSSLRRSAAWLLRAHAARLLVVAYLLLTTLLLALSALHESSHDEYEAGSSSLCHRAPSAVAAESTAPKPTQTVTFEGDGSRGSTLAA